MKPDPAHHPDDRQRPADASGAQVRARSCLNFRGVARATVFSWQGLRHAARHERAFRQELALLVVLVPLACWLPVGRLERLVLILSMLLVLVVELLNSSIEASVDLISVDYHELAKRAKDMGSAAVFVALLISVVAWATIAGPLLLRSLDAR